MLSVLTEVLFSMLLAPILMMFYTRFVISALTGLTVKWGKQKRGEEGPSWSELWGLLGVQTLIAIGVWLALAWTAPGLIPWLVPVLAGLILAVPFARVTASRRLGEAARAHGWFLIPEETNPPAELSALDAPASTGQSPFFAQEEYAEHLGLLQAVLDPYMHAVHVSLLRLRDQASDKSREYVQELTGKLLATGPAGLSKDERNNLLWDAEALMALHRELWICPQRTLAPWWQQALRHYNEATEIAWRRRATVAPPPPLAREEEELLAAR
jgi:membrane glycosyltransferase